MTGRARLAGLDGVRAVAMAGVVAVHAALSYLDTPIGWAVRDGARSLAVDGAVWIGRQFLMPTFFFLSGCLARVMLESRGARALIVHRVRRVAVPLAVFLIPTSLALDALWDHGRARWGRDPVADQVPALRGSGLPVTLGHLWYLYYLLVVTGAVLVADRAWRRLPAGPRGWVAAALDRLTGSALAPLIVAVPTAALLAVAGQLQVDTPLSFAVDPVIAIYFGGFFAWGWLVGARPAALAGAARTGPGHALAGAALIAVTIPALLRGRDAGAGPGPLELYAAAASSWLLVAALIGLARRWPVTARPAPALAAAARASYWTYLIHLPLVVALQLVAAELAWPGPVEYVLAIVVVGAVALGSHRLVAATRVGRLLGA